MIQRAERLSRLVGPVQRFINTEAASGIVLLAAAVLAIGWANSPWADRYTTLAHHHVAVDLGFWSFDHALEFWANDAAMVLFFFLVGLEIKREAVVGELSDLRRMIVPVAGAFGGMIAPALIFVALVYGHEGGAGWGIPIATDIAFTLGVLMVVRPAVPLGLKIMLLALAIVDDIGGIMVIALFYTEQLALLPLGIAAATIVAAFVLQRSGLRLVAAYVLLGVIGWAAMLESGVHPTIIGVAFGLLMPLTPWRAPDEVERVASADLERYRAARTETDPDIAHSERASALTRLRTLTSEGISPLERIEHTLQPWVAFVIVPAFAFLNAGVSLTPEAISDATGSPITRGVALGLLLGKPIGIVLAIWLAVRLGARLPGGVTWPLVAGVGVLAGIGFTVSLLIANLSYTDAASIADAKVGVLAGSLLAGIIGWTLLQRFSAVAQRPS